jgi:WRKY transcription factor 2
MIQGQASPTTGKLFMLGDSNNNNLARFEAPSIEDGPGTFCFKSLDLKSSQYAAEGNKVSSYVKLSIFSLSFVRFRISETC